LNNNNKIYIWLLNVESGKMVHFSPLLPFNEFSLKVSDYRKLLNQKVFLHIEAKNKGGKMIACVADIYSAL
jgi:hypothetical protein